MNAQHLLRPDSRSGSVIFTEKYVSPCGTLLLGATARALVLCDWDTPTAAHRHRRLALFRLEDGGNDITASTRRQLDEYFAGKRHIFDVPLLHVGTAMEMSVWQTLRQVGYGQTTTYGQLASMAGYPRAVRAVASAVGHNLISILVPCHRILPASGAIGNYDGGPLAKQYLLTLEQSYPPTK